MCNDRPTTPIGPRRHTPSHAAERLTRVPESPPVGDASRTEGRDALFQLAAALPIQQGPLAFARAFCAAVSEFAPGTCVGLRWREGTSATRAFAGVASDDLVPPETDEADGDDLRPMFQARDAVIVVPIEWGSVRSLHLAADAPTTTFQLEGLAEHVLPLLLAGATAEAEARRARVGIEHQKRIERRVLDAERKIAVADFASRLVHDLQQPLTAVGAFAGHLAGVMDRLAIDPIYAKRMRALDAAIDASKSLARLLLFHALPLRESPVVIDLEQLARGATRLSERDAERVGARLTITTTDAKCMAFGRASELTRVLLNLLRNACDAIGALERVSGGVVDVSVSTLPSGDACIAVTDDGCGIPPDSIGRLFEPFYSTKPADQGTGLGLAIAREIIAAHGGTLTAHHVDGGGARFVIALPPIDASPFRYPASVSATE